MKDKWVSAKDLMEMIPGLSYLRALKHIREIRQKMVDDGLRLPETREHLVLKKYVENSVDYFGRGSFKLTFAASSFSCHSSMESSE